MWTGTLALMEWSLRRGVHLLRPHLFRVLIVGVIFFSLFVVHASSVMFGAPGLKFFASITVLNVVVITLAGIGFFSSVISEEKDESTIGLLKMAGISPVSLLLGKSTAQLISASMVLTVQFPFTLLAITLGGVTLSQVFAAYMALLAYMVFVANLGLFCSVYSKTSSRASGLMAVLLLAGPYLVSQSHAALVRSIGTVADDRWLLTIAATVLGWLDDFSVTTRIGIILSTGFAEPIFSDQVAWCFASSLLVFLASWVLFEPMTREHRTSTAIADLMLPTRWRTDTRKPRRAWKNAIMWKDFYLLAGGWRTMIAKCFIYGAVAACAAHFLYDVGLGRSSASVAAGRFQYGRYAEFVQAALVATLFIAAAELSVFVAKMFRDEVKQKTLPLLIMLPTSTTHMIYSKAAGGLLAIGPAAACFIAICVVFPASTESVVAEISNPLVIWSAVSAFAVFVYLVGYLSLSVKLWAIPLALFFVYFVSYCCVTPFVLVWMIPGRLAGSAIIQILPIVAICAAACFGLQKAIEDRLNEHASR